MTLPAFTEITAEQRRRNMEATETRMAPTMIFEDGLSTGDYYPRWYGGYLAPTKEIA